MSTAIFVLAVTIAIFAQAKTTPQFIAVGSVIVVLVICSTVIWVWGP